MKPVLAEAAIKKHVKTHNMKKGIKISWLSIFNGRLTKVIGESVTDAFGFEGDFAIKDSK